MMPFFGQRLSRHDRNELLKVTHFKNSELQLWHKAFLGICPRGRFSNDNLRFLWTQLYLLDTLNCHQFGSIDFKEFIKLLSMTMRGSEEERLRWLFGMYDQDKDEKITRSELHRYYTAAYRLNRPWAMQDEDENHPSQQLDEFFKLADKNNKGYIIWTEFEEAYKTDPSKFDLFPKCQDMKEVPEQSSDITSQHHIIRPRPVSASHPSITTSRPASSRSARPSRPASSVPSFRTTSYPESYTSRTPSLVPSLTPLPPSLSPPSRPLSIIEDHTISTSLPSTSRPPSRDTSHRVHGTSQNVNMSTVSSMEPLSPITPSRLPSPRLPLLDSSSHYHTPILPTVTTAPSSPSSLSLTDRVPSAIEPEYNKPRLPTQHETVQPSPSRTRYHHYLTSWPTAEVPYETPHVLPLHLTSTPS